MRITKLPHRNLGKWSTAEIFYHLSAAFEASVDPHGLPPGFPTVVRWLVRPARRFVTHIRFPPWLPIPAAIAYKLRPPKGVDLEQQRERLLRAIEIFDNYDGPVPPHPVLGPLSRTEWIGFHLRHCEHHLSFVQIEEPTTGS